MFVNGVINGDIYKTERVCCCLPHFMLSVTKILWLLRAPGVQQAHVQIYSVLICAAEFGSIRVWWCQFVYIQLHVNAIKHVNKERTQKYSADLILLLFFLPSLNTSNVQRTVETEQFLLFY